MSSVLALSGAVAIGGTVVAALVVPWVALETRIGIVVFAWALPAIAVASWCNRIFLAAQRFDLLWRLVAVQAPAVAAATLGGAVAFDFGGALMDGRRALELAAGYVDALTIVGRVLLEIGPLPEAS